MAPYPSSVHDTAARRLVRRALCLVTYTLAACSGPQEAERVELQVVTDGSELRAVTTDLGYQVELASVSIAANDLKFTIAGEIHASFWRGLSDALVPPAHAHPGHYQGGEVTGELPGHFILRFAPGQEREVGTAILLAGKYRAANLTLSYASSDDAGMTEGDPLAGHSAVLAGTASRDGVTLDFEVVIDSPEGRELVGIPFDEEITAPGERTLALQFLPRDPLEDDTLFDGVDFAALDRDADGHVAIDSSASDAATVAAYNAIRRVFQTHDHFSVQSRR